MEWFYAYQGQQRGPIDEAELLDLALKGIITPDTLIWRQGMANWTRYAEAAPRAAAPAAPAASVEFAAPIAPAADPAAGRNYCAECGRSFPASEMVHYGNSYVCPSCKPVFFQRIQEGAPAATGAMRYAGFWIRFGAAFIDGILLNLSSLVVGLIGGAISSAGDAGAVAGGSLLAVYYLAMLAYGPFMHGKYGATLGKMAVKIKVVRADGAPISYGLAVGRSFAKLLSGIILYIGFIVAGFDQEKRALHDHICNTRVIYKD
jgi:uncharacterized RDD family membrane protein YckC/DNA-directed RNA polymerase subunit RPC12/RpoP